MSISIRRQGNEWLKQFQKYIMAMIKENEYTEKTICAIAFMNEGIKPETTSKYIRHLTEYGVIEELDNGILTMMIEIDLTEKRADIDEKMKPYKEGKKKSEKEEYKEYVERMKKKKSKNILSFKDWKGKKIDIDTPKENPIEDNQQQKEIDNNLYIMYVGNCIKDKEVPLTYDVWITQKYTNPDIVEENESKGKDTIPVKLLKGELE